MPGIVVLSALYALFHLIFTTASWGTYYLYSYWRNWVLKRMTNFSKFSELVKVEPDLNLGLCDSKAQTQPCAIFLHKTPQALTEAQIDFATS